MEATPSTPARQPPLRAIARWDPLTWLAVICLLLGWFYVKCLIVWVSGIEHGVRFYDLPAIVLKPSQLFFGVRHYYLLLALPFGALCLACIYALLLPYQGLPRETWLLHLLPLIVLVGSYALLYHRTGHELIRTDPDTVAGDLTRLANNLWSRGTGLVTRHVSVAGGAYVALAGSLFLAARGLLRYFKPA
ncbi:MAG TPA: hypothetical protein VFG49_15890 [Dyella sp.]|uniref:hypothetical protein n=1 Tax=Dyella sp. TaxID=1869338 RepID=UPI002D790588|nr:hypothetical protein [Dyella sp.]HET6555009.1 hypothetical protein [Dyella sp.]